MRRLNHAHTAVGLIVTTEDLINKEIINIGPDSV